MLTREEAHTYIEEQRPIKGMRIASKMAIDAVYDSIGTCSTCTFYTSGTCKNKALEDKLYPNIEVLDDSGLYLVDFEVEADFCCNLFKVKEL